MKDQKSKKVAIHQVNFFPWLPFFHKIAAVDHFILLDDVQYERTGAGSWQNRVRLACQGQLYWLTCPLDRSVPKTAKIMEMQRLADNSWVKKAKKTLQHHYSKSKHFDEIMPTVSELMQYESGNLAQYNENAIRTLCKKLCLSTSISRSSELEVISTGTQRLIDLVKSVNGSTYYAGRNASETYQENETFGEQGLSLSIENYSAKPYSQAGNKEFISGLSIIDTLMNVGFEKTRQLIQ